MRNTTKNWLWKALLLSMALFLGISSMTWAQGKKAPEKDPSTITIVPMTDESGGRAVGDNCTDPIVVSIPSALPYSNANYTCGRGNTYSLPSSECMSYYTSGEDLIYRLDVSVNTTVTLTMNPGPTSYPGMGIFSGCPAVGNCIAAATNYAAVPLEISGVNLVAGNQYYVMIDTWASPTCIPSLTFSIVGVTPPPPPPPGSCDYTISLYDSYGDGWNGCKLDVLVDGVVRLNDITLASGYGPATFTFPTNTGAVITTQFTIGSWASEPYYYIYNNSGQQVWYAPAGNSSGPANILPGQLYGNCPLPPGDVEGYVFNYDGLAISGATIAVEDGPSTTSGPDGSYLLTGIPAGDVAISCGKAGYNITTDIVTIIELDVVTHNFTLTQPNMIVNPLYIEETLNPGEYFTTSLNVLNNGNGPLGWTAEVVYPEVDYVPAPTVEPNGSAAIGYGEATGDGNRDLLMCPEGSLFSIPVVGTTNAYTSTASAGYKCYQSFGDVESPISTVTFWGCFSSGTLPTTPGNFTIEFYTGSTPSTLVYGETQSLVAVNTGQLLLGSYQIGVFTAVLASPVDLEAGWLSVQWQSSPTFYWENTTAGAGYPAYQNSTSLPERLAMCLAGGGAAGGWLTMDYYEGEVPAFGGVDNIPTHLNAAGTQPGEVYTADIVFTSTPFVGEITVPVTMIIMGNELVAPDNLEVVLANDVTGLVNLTWTWDGDAFQFFLIKRNGVIVGTTTNTYFNDILPDYGEFCYTVQAVYDEGATSPAGPECIEWPNPVLFVNPDDLHGWVWQGFTVDVYTTISNLGEGTLAFTFPEWAALSLLNDPTVEKNMPGTPYANREQEIAKDDESLDGTGYPIVLGAGGPDDFGYVWIDSDETGGPSFNWIDITATGTAVSTSTLGDDGKVGPFNLGFPFEYYGEEKTQFWIASNGAVCFTSAYHTYSNTGIPTNNSSYVDFIALFWDDLYSTYAGTAIYYQNFADYTVVQWNDAQRLSYSGYTMDMQAILYKNGKIKVQYKDITSGFILNSATIGLQSSDPGLGLQVSYNTTYVHNNLAILYSLPADFIIDVQPAFGTIAEGESREITITYDSQDYEPGDYTQELLLESNDPNNAEYIIMNTMHVYVPAQFAGQVIDNDNGDPLVGVKVTAGQYQTTTNDEGNYSLYVDQGEYDVVFEKLGYMTVTVADTFALAGIVTPINIGMWDNNYAPGMVHAEVMDNDTWCEVTWTLPNGPYEITMDDGEADDYFIYANAGGMNAVKFTPTGYPATVIGGQFYVGDGNFPGPFIGSMFSVAIFDDDGANGLPGTMLDSNSVTVNNYGWVSLDWMNATIEDGSFYLAMIQTAASPFSAPIGVDTDNPTYFRSYSFLVGAPDWILSPLQDFMIRAWIVGAEGDMMANNAKGEWKATPRVPAIWTNYAATASGTLPRILPGYERNDVQIKAVQGMANRDVTNYRVARYSQFDPNGSPAAGTLTELATTANQFYNDNAWAGLPMGWYAYGVKALYTSGLYSNYTISNIVGHLMDYQVTVNCELSTGLEPVNVEVTLQGLEWPYETYFAVTPASGTVVFESVWRGHYDITAYKIGYDVYKINNAFVNADKVYNIMLSEKKYPPTCLVVDPVSLEATWCEPLRTALEENFESALFPPAGWQVLSQGEGGWVRTDDGSSGSWTIPTWDSYYAVANDDAAGSDNDGCCDYLITPPCDMRESEGYVLSFNSYYDGLYGQLAFVEYSVDGGATWEVLSQMMPGTSWTDQEIDLAAFSGLAGPANVWFAFHADDAGEYASGWAIDNVLVQVPAPAANYIDFWVFLDNAFKGVTTETNWNYAPLWYGQTYTAGVAARYTSGLSAKDTYTFFCEYLFPPDSLEGFAPDDAAILTWWPPLEYWPVMATAGNGPLYSKSEINFVAGEVANKEAISRQGATDVIVSETGTRDVGDVILSFPAPSPIGLCWGICDDGENLWISDPNVSATVIYQVDYEGVNTGNTITISQGQSWVGDMASDGEFLYGCLVGGSNAIVKVDLATGETVGTIGGDFTVTSQRGLGVDFVNEEFYIGGWNSNQIWRTDFEGTTISTFGFSGVSGLAWHPNGGPDAEGALWVVVNAATDNVTEVDPNNGWATIQAFVMPNDQGYSGAGMEIKISNPDGGALWICNQSDNTIYLVDTEELLNIGPVAGLPENILGYNVYRDMEFVAYTAHTPEEEYVMQGYVEENLEPGIYQYTVTAVYDLARYGFPGETGESMHEGPAEVVVDYCYELEFMETWSLGNFDDNNWLTDGSNWSINGQEGNPEPVAEFTWDPILTNYTMNMESFPLCAQGMTEGRIYLDFDLKLESVQPTGMEMMNVQVWNWDSKVWSTVATYSNVDGSFDWMSEHLDIKSQAMNKVFKIRFQATGANSIDILSWFVDNIHVYRSCDGITELDAQADGNLSGIELTWVGPDLDIVDEWIHWDDGVFSGTSIGTGEAVQFDVAHRWEPAQMTEWEGASVTEIAFVPAEANCAYYVRVWIGAGAANLVADQMVPSPVIGEWNYVTLATPVPIDITQELYIGYYVDAQTGYPAGCDDGPAIDGYGNMMNFGGWQTLLQINPELDYNWNITGHLQTVTGAVMPMSKTVTPSAINGQSLATSPVQMSPKMFAPANGGRDLAGFNIYRAIEGGEYTLLDFTTEMSYVDTDEDLVIGTMYCYMVTAVWQGETGDVCESAFSEVACELWTSIGDNDGATASFSLYPNPASEYVTITTSGDLKRVTVYNALGQLVVDEIITGKQYELAVSSYTIGVYMVRVETEAGITTRTLTIQR
ncbi:MAG: carboxypeptidase regulatory-like domain-containing protein [Bacteroidales bacterium]|nr:carboxypeptidase regulatory-like domain-containing protein [Bacteroidales bacterium]